MKNGMGIGDSLRKNDRETQAPGRAQPASVIGVKRSGVKLLETLGIWDPFMQGPKTPLNSVRKS
jgi:hypothetical protein